MTTPYDIMINQVLEQSRGAGRHGSCGVGFGETIEREENGPVLRARTLTEPGHARSVLEEIRSRYVPARLERLGLEGLEASWLEDRILDRYLEDAEAFMEAVELRGPQALARHHRIVLEGAQGLLLDMDLGAFPHVTRSNTGIRNARNVAEAAGIDRLDVIYVTRAYATRHGAGPLAHEVRGPSPPGIEDRTNLANDWQGRLRIGHLDLDTLRGAIDQDLKSCPGAIRRARILLTCLDQVPDLVTCFDAGTRRAVTRTELADTLARRTGAEVLTSTGPTREDIRTWGTDRETRVPAGWPGTDAQGAGPYRVAELE